MFKLPKNICSFAKDVLYGNNLELKLISPEGVLSDPGTGSVDLKGELNIDCQVPRPPKFEAPLFCSAAIINVDEFSDDFIQVWYELVL